MVVFFVLDGSKEYPILEDLRRLIPDKFAFVRTDDYIHITKCEPDEVLLSLYKLDGELNAELNALRLRGYVYYGNGVLTLFDRLISYINTFEDRDDLKLNLLEISKCIDGGSESSNGVSWLIQDLDELAIIVLKSLLKQLANLKTDVILKEYIVKYIYDILSAKPSAFSRCVKSSNNRKITAVSADRKVGPVFEIINEFVENGQSILNYEISGVNKQYLDYVCNMLNKTGNKAYYIMTAEDMANIIVVVCLGVTIY